MLDKNLGMKKGEPIIARIRAQNVEGWGEWSPLSNGEARKVGIPSQLPPPKLLRKTLTKVELGWGESVEEGSSFILFMAKGSGEFKKVDAVATSSTEHEVSELDRDETYRFKI